MRLTELAHDAVRAVLCPGDIAIDATAGNGHDTRFLAACVGDEGHVYAFDIQQVKVASSSHITMIVSNHADMHQHIPAIHHGKIGAVMFNLGYLPGGNHSIITQPDSTIAALRVALALLKTGGVLTVMTYRGHDGGTQEDEAVRLFLESTEFDLQMIDSEGPRLYIVRKALRCPR